MVKIKRESVERKEQLKLLTLQRDELQPIYENRELIERALQKAELLITLGEQEKEIAKLKQQAQTDCEEAKTAYLKGEEAYKQAKSALDQADLGYKRMAIGIAASLLFPGRPCPVCGSMEHPDPSQTCHELITEEELTLRKKKVEETNALLLHLHGEASEAMTKLQTVIEQLAAKKEEKKAEEESYWQDRRLIQDIPGMDEIQKNAQIDVKILEKKVTQYEQTIAHIESEEERSLLLVEAKKEAEGEVERTRKQKEEAFAKYGFAGEEAYLAAHMEETSRRRLEAELKEYQNQCAANKELFRHLTESTGNKVKSDFFKLEQQLEALRQEYSANQEERKSCHTQLENVIRTATTLNKKRGLLKKAAEEYGYVKDLWNIASGNNSKRIVFEQYVLAGYFEEILMAANLRFGKMTAGRYRMSRVEQVGDGRIKDNLEIQVMDHYTGKYRNIRTLSGGESFKASLSLALGMSDVVQAMHGGIRVEALFVDEGFGALDGESLDQACETLMGLVDNNKMIGIISHVEQLRERITSQLVVEKTNFGSHVNIVSS